MNFTINIKLLTLEKTNFPRRIFIKLQHFYIMETVFTINFIILI